jgi:hypothetical protein
MSAAARDRIGSKHRPDSKLLSPLVSAVITAITTLGVSIIGVFPQLRSQDRTTIEELRTDMQKMKESLGASSKPAEKNSTFSGNIQLVKRNSTGNDADQIVDVSLVNEEMGSSTDSAGNYRIKNVPLGDYTLLVRIPGENNKTFTMHVPSDQATGTLNPVNGVSITYARNEGP